MAFSKKKKGQLTKFPRALRVPNVLLTISHWALHSSDTSHLFSPTPTDLGRSTLAKLARVSKDFSDAALNVLWRDPGIEPLFDILAQVSIHHLTRKLAFVNNTNALDWRRFEHYAPRLRRLTYYADIHPDLFSAIARTRATIVILPELTDLTWTIDTSHDALAALMFLPTSLESVQLRLSRPPIETDEYAHAVALLFSRMQFALQNVHTISFEIRWSGPFPEQVAAAMTDLLVVLPKLERFIMQAPPSIALRCLSALSPSKSVAHIAIDCWGMPLERPFTLPLAEDPFPALISLATRGPREIPAAISWKIQTTHIRGIDIEFPADGETTISERQLFQTLLRFKELRYLRFYTADLWDRDLIGISAAWPHLQVLRLGDGKSELTLAGMFALCQACPELEEIDIPLDASNASSLPPPAVQQYDSSVLSSLNLRRWRITDPFATAMALSRFPALANLNWTPALHPQTREEEAALAMFVGIRTLLTQFQSVREQERRAALAARGGVSDTSLGPRGAGRSRAGSEVSSAPVIPWGGSTSHKRRPSRFNFSLRSVFSRNK